MSDLNLSILGFPAVNRDLTVEIRDPASNAVVRQVQPFLDGTVRVSQLAAGAYELTVRHPNLTLPVIRRPVRILPTGDTRISVVIDPTQFRNTPIEDIPEANLGPVRGSAESIAETMVSLTSKRPGESIKAEDWNVMASSIRDLALGLAEVLRLVSPTGHDHPEFVRKFDEVTTNFETLLNTLTAALAELQRQIQAERVRNQIEDMLDVAGVDKASPRGREFLGLVADLNSSVTESPAAFSRKARNIGVQLGTKIEALIDENPAVVSSEQVKTLSTATDILKAQQSTSYDSELEHFRRADRTLGPALIRRQP